MFQEVNGNLSLIYMLIYGRQGVIEIYEGSNKSHKRYPDIIGNDSVGYCDGIGDGYIF